MGVRWRPEKGRDPENVIRGKILGEKLASVKFLFAGTVATRLYYSVLRSWGLVFLDTYIVQKPQESLPKIWEA